MEVLYLPILRFGAVDHEHVRLMGDRQFVRGKPRHRDDDAVCIFAKFGGAIEGNRRESSFRSWSSAFKKSVSPRRKLRGSDEHSI